MGGMCFFSAMQTTIFVAAPECAPRESSTVADKCRFSMIAAHNSQTKNYDG